MSEPRNQTNRSETSQDQTTQGPATQRVEAAGEQVALSSRSRAFLEVDGLKFRDLDGDGVLSPFEDWRLPATERAADLAARMAPDEKAGLMVISSRSMGISQHDPELTSHDGLLDEQYFKVKMDPHNTAGLPSEGTTQQITEMHMRRFIMRETPSGGDIARWVNAMQEVAETTRWSIPVLVAANSKNEMGGFVMGGTPNDVPFTQFPGTLGLAASCDVELISRFAQQSRQEWRASGLRKGYMYMADVVTDPRWFRTYGTFGERPEFVSQAISAVIKGFQGEDGVDVDGVALTTKHFPGGGARENGFDPHYAEGRFNVYRTPNSLENYHLPPFQAAVDAKTASIMPYYAIPSDLKSTMPQPPLGDFEQVGFAFNHEVLRVLREMGHTGYINSDSGILNKMAWGVEELSVPERVGAAVMAGTDVIADTNDVGSVREAYLKGLFTHERLDGAAAALLTEMFQLGIFDNPYVDPDEADRVVACDDFQALAEEAHRKSVVLLKNPTRDEQPVLPLTPERLAGRRVYLESFAKGVTVRQLDRFRAQVAESHPEVDFTTDHRDADVAVLVVRPSTGDYFRATGLYQLGIHDGTNVDIEKIRTIRENVGTVVVILDVALSWIPQNVEPLADALLAGFDTRHDVLVDAVFGGFTPTGKLPLSLPASEEVVAVDADGICASPNDVPGYDKEKYMNGRQYVYVDSDGNRYVSGFGL